jgi:hypothetical protein
MPSKGIQFSDLPVDAQNRVKAQAHIRRTYTKSQVVKVAGAVLVALGSEGLPLTGQRESLTLVQRWLRGVRD